MSTVELGQPLPDSGILSVNFFNGRLLSGDDLNIEQDANRTEHTQLGVAIGEGIAWGLEVSPSTATSVDQTLAVTVKPGLAINRTGQTLALTSSIDVSLVSSASASSSTVPPPSPPATTTATTPQTGVFSPMQATTPPADYIAGEAVFLLTLSPATKNQGLAPVVGAEGGSTYNTRYFVDTLQFRLLPFNLTRQVLHDVAHLRNYIAYACFGFTDGSVPSFELSPLSAPLQSYGLLDTLRPKALTDDDVPLAVLSLTFTGQLNFIDLWSVRRRLVHRATSMQLDGLLGDRRRAESEAMFFQFQEQLAGILREAQIPPQTASQQKVSLKTLSADQRFIYLPAAGYLPIGTNGFDWQTFLGELAPPAVACIDAGSLRSILHTSFFTDPIPVVAAGDCTTPKTPVDVYQDPSKPDVVLFARSLSGRIHVTVTAQGFQPAEAMVTVGQQTALTIPLQQDPTLLQQRPMEIDGVSLEKPPFTVRLSMTFLHRTFSQKDRDELRKVSSLSQPALDWLNAWKSWLDQQYPYQGIDCSTPAIWVNPDYMPPRRQKGEPIKPGAIPIDPQVYAVFDTFAVPLIVNVPYRTLPLPVSLTRAGIPGLSDDIVHKLATAGITSIDQLAGAWADLIAGATGFSTDYGQYLIADAIEKVEDIKEDLRYYSGVDHKVEKVLKEEMAIYDDVGLANADPDELGKALKVKVDDVELPSPIFASGLIEEARTVVPPDTWHLQKLGLTPDQITALGRLKIRSKGEFAVKAVDERDKVAKLLGVTPQAVDDYHTNAVRQVTADSIAYLPIKDLALLPAMDVDTANKLAKIGILTVDALAMADETELDAVDIAMDKVNSLKQQANNVVARNQEVVKLASITKGIASGIETVNILKNVKIGELLDKPEDEVEGFFKGIGRVSRAVIQGIKDGLAGRLLT